MPQMNYIALQEYAALGIPSATDEQVSVASNIVDAYLQRTEGLLWTPDASGLPLCMTRKNPESSRTLTGSVVPGLLVAVSISNGPLITQGDDFVINRAGNTAETCKVQSVTSQNQIVLASVTNIHNSGETVETGLCITEVVNLPKNRTVATLSKGPIARMVSTLGRITYSRRGNDTYMQTMQDYGMLAAVSAFGGAPVWQDVPVSAADIDIQNNQVWCPTGILMVPYNEVKFTYIAGFSLAGLPYQVKQATANILTAIAESPASSGIKMFKAGETQMERFLDTIITTDTERLLAPYMAKNYV